MCAPSISSFWVLNSTLNYVIGHLGNSESEVAYLPRLLLPALLITLEAVVKSKNIHITERFLVERTL